jgi:hypothetical protein
MDPIIAGASQFISKLLTSKSTGFSDGMDVMGNFDVDSFINSNLGKAKNTPGTDLPKVTQGIAQLLGFGPKKMIGSPETQGQDSWYKGP